MSWLRRRQVDARPAEQRSMTPTDAADLAAAKRARQQVEQEIESGRSRWPIILAAVSYLRQVHEENHLADDLRMIFSGHQRG